MQSGYNLKVISCIIRDYEIEPANIEIAAGMMVQVLHLNDLSHIHFNSLKT